MDRRDLSRRCRKRGGIDCKHTDRRQFHGAKDQIAIAGRDISLATAAHNAARFPFINAIGALTAQDSVYRTRRDDSPPEEPSRSDRPVCGHLADGGYFDNSGGQTTLDLLQTFGRCLEIQSADSVDREFDPCLQMDGTHRRWLRDNHPERSACQPRANLFVGFAGPAIAALQVGGIGANGRLSEARQVHAVRALRASMGPAAASARAAPVTVIDLLPNGTRYPLGWHLSPRALGDIQSQARSCEHSPAQSDAPSTVPATAAR